jgi:ABC-type multidrug transport system permease subunit
MNNDPKYRSSQRRELSPQQWRRLGLLIGVLILVLVAVVLVAVLVAFGEITF